MSIDVGSACIDRSTYQLGGFTVVAKENPANASGTIDHLCIWLSAFSSGNFDFASFADEGSNVLSTNGVAQGLTCAVGQNEFNAPGDFTAFDINSGEYLGYYTQASDNRVEKTTSGSGLWRYDGADQIPCSSVTFAVQADRACSIYATGTETGGEPTFGPRLMAFMI